MKTDPNEMEMPCMCKCGEWFDLETGNPSSKGSDLICDDCFNIEEAEEERSQQIEDLTNMIEDAILTIREAKKQLSDLSEPYTKEIIF